LPAAITPCCRTRGSKRFERQYVIHVTRMFQLDRDTAERARSEAQSVIAIETALAQGSLSRTDMRTRRNAIT
jgi:putative endopeptidase